MFRWKDSFSCNIKTIDEQHQKLFELGGNMRELLSMNDSIDHYDEIMEILNELREYTIYHFNYEEGIMEKYDYDALEAHKQEHSAFIGKLNEISNKDIDENQKEAIMDILVFVADWIAVHIQQTDKQYQPYLNLKGVF